MPQKKHCVGCGREFERPRGRRTDAEWAKRRFCTSRCGRRWGIAQVSEDDLRTKIRKVSAVDPATGCWNFTGAARNKGYGQISIRGKVTLAHRAAYELFLGPIPSGLQICHRCDNPLCINPSHLFAGSAEENMQDAAKKGRTARGGNHPCAKLTEADARAIRGMEGHPREIARRFNVSPSAVIGIRLRRTWKHLEEPAP